MEILIISGLSGGGKSKAASYLEDMGFYTVDNMPAAMILKFAEFCITSNGRYERVALVYDVRALEPFEELFHVLDLLREMDCKCSLLFLEASCETIIKRFKETRRMHPLMGKAGSIEQAVRQEIELLRVVRDRADIVLNTTTFPIAKLRSELRALFDSAGASRSDLQVNVVSFGFKHGIPIEADLVFDVRFMPNPFYIEELRDKTGMDQEVYDYVMSFQQTKTFLEKLEDMVKYLLPLYSEEGKSMLVIAIGCTGGHHRSVSVARALTAYINTLEGFSATENHRDMTRK
ncbi:MAG: RNase adapter RapZ [Oscillospiraceae bacterium]|nr:RNase adapter RapZ [Oscillospiraceae bacterium]